ncbi:MAG: hypothetical protein QOE45_2624 [Frankiaceae bacterium]|jgi:hypothetical protein|nr:hypothetical protein [Frankiaceae bacterium]
MNQHPLTEQLAYEHVADLRRDAVGHPRAASRADRTQGHGRPRLAAFRRPAAVGCEA